MRIFVVFCIIGGVALFVHSISVSDFKTACDAIDSEAEKRSMYYEGTCIVAREPATKLSHNAAKTMCHDMEHSKFRGHLVHVPDLKTIKAIIEILPIGQYYSIGIEQSDDTSGIGRNWYWLDENGLLRWSADKSIENQWQDGQPNNMPYGGNQWQDCGLLTPTVASVLSLLDDVLCTSIRKFSFICQYHNPTQQYSRWNEKNKMGNNATLIEHGNMAARSDCAYKCRNTLVCKAFAYHEQTNDCRIYWTNDKEDYPLENENGYYFYFVH